MTAAALLSALAFGLLGYLSGSLAFAVWVTRLVRGRDVRDAGSGHATATNTLRQAGVLPGLLVFVLDLAKGFLPTWLALQYAPEPWIAPLTAVLAVAGHCWPVMAGFRGGMGLATAGGGMLAAAPLAVLVCAALLIALLLVIRHAARASVLAGILFAPVLALAGLRGPVIWIALATGALIAIRFLVDWKRRYRELWLDRERVH